MCIYEEKELIQKITSILDDIGLNPSLLGYHYIVESIKCYYNSYVNNNCKNLLNRCGIVVTVCGLVIILNNMERLFATCTCLVIRSLY